MPRKLKLTPLESRLLEVLTDFEPDAFGREEDLFTLVITCADEPENVGYRSNLQDYAAALHHLAQLHLIRFEIERDSRIWNSLPDYINTDDIPSFIQKTISYDKESYTFQLRDLKTARKAVVIRTEIPH